MSNTDTQAWREHATANEEMINEMRSREGKEIRRDHNPQFYTEFNQDAIKTYAFGIGDPNPIYYDEDYAAATPFGTRIAPPTILFALGVGTLMATTLGMPGLHALYKGTEFWFYKPWKLGDKPTSKFTYGAIDVIEGGSSFAGNAINQSMIGEFYNQHGELVSKSNDHIIRFDRGSGGSRSKFEDLKLWEYSPEDIAAIDADYDKEVRRGSEPRYWEDVEIGEEIPWIVKGPLTVTDMIAYKVGWGHYPFCRPNRFQLEYRRKHPKAYTPNSRGVPDIPARVHWEDELAQTIGIPAAFDYGPQRVSWMAHFLFNWTGDHGWIEYVNTQLREPILVGDTSWFEGKVTGKEQEEGKNLVEIEFWGRDQRDRITTRGTAKVSLPSRASQ